MKLLNTLILFLLSLIISISCVAQFNPINYNANTHTNKYQGTFLFGSNMGWRGYNWQDEDIANILVGNTELGLEGVGCNSLRPALYEYFVEQWGYDIRIDAFKHYEQLGAKDNVVFIGYPSDEHREDTSYCVEDGQTIQSEMFANLYEPIWLENSGIAGWKINTNNYYANYVYEVVKRYGGQVKFWEIMNEPDFTYYGTGDLAPEDEGNWWTNDPPPVELSAIRAPIQSYIRMLRISYEVIKALDSTAFVCLGGIGYASFLDAILRNTDNPDGGKVTAEYSEKGGAWFDCVSYHIYPMYYLREWNNDIGDFDYFRNSDAAVASMLERKNWFVEILEKYGYGTNYPTKEFIITETNIPSKQFDDNIGSLKAQRNYLVKAAVEAMKNGISMLQVYGAYDGCDEEEMTNSYDPCGLYEYLPEEPYDGLKVKESGIAWRTASEQLKDRYFDSSRTKQMNLPNNIGGGAFNSTEWKDTMYVLWAKSKGDVEEATSEFTFPTYNAFGLRVINWDGTIDTILGTTIQLTESPIFVRIEYEVGIAEQSEIKFQVSPNITDGKISVQFELLNSEEINLRITDIAGNLLQNLYNANLQAGNYKYSFDLNIPIGAYILTLETSKGSLHRKIIRK
jgi:hypothetical protein